MLPLRGRDPSPGPCGRRRMPLRDDGIYLVVANFVLVLFVLVLTPAGGLLVDLILGAAKAFADWIIRVF